MSTRIICDNCEKRIDYANSDIFYVNWEETFYSYNEKTKQTFPCAEKPIKKEFCSKKCVSDYFKEVKND